jgi:LPXTG-motif cell wall-anchored protein
MRRPPLALIALAAGSLLAAPGLIGPASAAAPKGAAGACPAPPQLTFQEPTYVDKTRAGGEPLIFTYPNGRLLYSAHAGTTHFFAPEAPNTGTAAFGENYTGQTYIWTSDDNGKTWTFRPRIIAPSGAPASGFSDPEFAMDSAGGLYFSEINLANVAVSASREDHGTTWSLQNFTGAVLTDRQWMEADRKGELYFVANGQPGGTGIPPGVESGHYISKSTDGGVTFTASVPDTTGGQGLGDIRVDKRTGTVYEAHYDGNKLSIAAFRNARSGDLKATDTNVVADGVKMLAHWPAFDLDPSGNLYITWDESGKGGDREAGIYYSRSTDGGRTWATPVRVDRDDHTDIWPWIGVGDDGRVAIAWLGADKKLPNEDAQTAGTYGWRIIGAVTTTGLGCASSATPSFSVATATKDPVHTGTICQGGTVCQAQLIDRRLGDYFSVEVDGTGRMWAGYSDTRVPGSVSLPAFVRQQGGPSLLVPKRAGTTPTATTGKPPAAVDAGSTPSAGGGSLASTGSGAQLPAAAALLLLGAALLLRRRRA